MGAASPSSAPRTLAASRNTAPLDGTANFARPTRRGLTFVNIGCIRQRRTVFRPGKWEHHTNVYDPDPARRR
jgi:hypothetical protein